MIIGYSRLWGGEQSLEPQRRTLRAAGCEIIYEDRDVSASAHAPPGLDEAMSVARTGDTLVVCGLDRIARSLPHLFELIDHLRENRIGFHALDEDITTTGEGAAFYLHILEALAAFDHKTRSHSTRSGMAAAGRRGRTIGRPRKLTAAQITEARASLDAGASPHAVARQFGVHVRTLLRTLGAPE